MEILINVLYIIVLAAVALLGGLGLVMYYSYINRWAPEAKTFAKCRKKNLPMIEVISGGRLGWIPGVKKDRKDLNFEDQGFGLHVDARTLGHQNPVVADGALQVLHWSPKYAFDITPHSVCGLLAIRNYVREHYAQLRYLTDIDLMTLIGTTRDDLPHDCLNYVDEESPAFTADDLIEIIEEIQDKTGTIPIEAGFFAFEEGIQLNPSVFLSQDVSVMMNIIRAQVLAEYKKGVDDIMKYAMAAMFVFVGAGLMLKIGGFV